MAASLPPEIWHMIVNSSSWKKNELRNLRLSSRQLSQATNPQLFESILLRPNIDSLNRARSLAQTPHLACHVQTLHVRCDAVPIHVVTAQDFREEVKLSVIPDYDKNQLYAEAERFTQDVPLMQEKQRAYRETGALKAVMALCESLPNLMHLDFRSDRDPSSDWSNRFGVEWDGAVGLLFEDQLQLCHNLKPVSMAFGQVEWCYFHDHTLVAWHKEWLSGLSHLKRLDFRLEMLLPPNSTDLLPRRLSNLLAATASVEDLCIGFEAGCHRVGREYRSVMAVLLQSTWPRLRRLQLKLMSARFEPLLAFLCRHSKTLQDLTLDNFILDDLKEEYPSGSELVTPSLVVNTIVALRENFRLKSFRIERFFGNPGIELFAAEEQCCQGSRLWHIQQFVCHAAGFPFPDTARSFGHPQWCDYESWDALREAQPPLPFPVWAKLHGVQTLATIPADILGAYNDPSWRLCSHDVSYWELDPELEEEDYDADEEEEGEEEEEEEDYYDDDEEEEEEEDYYDEEEEEEGDAEQEEDNESPENSVSNTLGFGTAIRLREFIPRGSNSPLLVIW